LNFERNGEQVNERYGKIKRATDEEVLDGFYHNGNRTFNRAIGNPTINQNLQGSSAPYVYFAFRGDDTQDSFNGGDTSASTGNVQGGTAFDTSLLVKNFNGNMSLNWDITINAFNPTAFSVGGEPTLDFRLKFFIVRISDDDDLANLTDAADGQGTVLEQVATQVEYDVEFSEGAANSNNIDLPFSGSVDISNDPVGTKYMLFCRFRMHDYAGTSVAGIGDDAGSVSLVYNTGSKFEIQGGTTFNVGESIDQPEYLLPKGSQSDFLMGIAQMFNLQFSTDAAAKVVKIEPYDHFYDSTSSAYDWSDKIDYSKGIEEEFIYDVKSKLVFKYKDASNDAFLDRYDKKNDVLWGSYKEIDETQSFFDGEYKVENKFFSPTFNWTEIDYIDKSASGTSFTNNKAPCIPIYHKEFSKLGTPDERADKSFDIGARILLLAPSSNMLSTDSGYTTRYSYAPLPDQDLSATSLSNTTFARANFINMDNLRTSGVRGVLSNGYEDVDLNLSYSNITFNSTENSGGEITMHGLYHYYYNKMVRQLKERPRLKIMYVNLSLSDISSLDLRKLVFIDGAYYRINKVIDYQPHKNVSTKIELAEYFELGRDTSQLGQTPSLENIRL
jgi:hypothetical protein